MIYYLLLCVSIILTVCKSSSYNAYAKRARPSLFATFAFNTVAYGVAACIAFVIMLFSEKSFSLPTLICAFAYAIIVLSLQTISITAMKVGAMSTTAICVMYGMIIPSLAGPLFYSEPFGILQGIGILLMLASLWLLKDKPNSDEGRALSKKWLILALFAFLLSGMAGVMEKIHQNTDGRNEKAMFVFIACLLMFLFSAAASIIMRKKDAQALQKRSLFAFAILSGGIIGIYSIVNLTLAGALDSMIYYPVANGGAILLTVIVSFTLFKEKLSRQKALGTVIGLLGIVALSLPF